VPYEAFLSAKPVITTHDAGGPLDIVADGRTGLVCEPTPGAIAHACRRLGESHETARALGSAGKAAAEAVTWDATIDRLLES
jgi:glycosyltransferase involved in cell wall biosynthesis